ncbi:MAG TPA: branched-chain amino acid aminotransferase [Mycobacteriales bacterium]|nr:branched-chain amino acid aminotransferase [Mycobacteriales bacterium]
MSADLFEVLEHPSPRSERERAELMADPGFGRVFSDHMATVDYDPDRGWHDATLRPYGPLQLDPSTMALHYGQEIFEGCKAYEQPDGSVATFRPDANAARLRSSSRRLAMPELPDELFIGSLEVLVRADRAWVPTGEGRSLYLRPFMIATDPYLGVRPSLTYKYVLIASTVAPIFGSVLAPVTVWLSTEYTRAAPGGTGAAKCAGNYAASLVAQAQAAEKGCDQVVWLDAVEHRWVEEMGGMNLCFVLRDGDETTLVTPELTGTLLPGVTRDSLLAIAPDLGLKVEERRIDTTEWEEGCASGRIAEVFACGTAAVVTPVGRVKHAGGEFAVGDGQPGAVTLRLRQALLDIQTGAAPDPHGWRYVLAPA